MCVGWKNRISSALLYNACLQQVIFDRLILVWGQGYEDCRVHSEQMSAASRVDCHSWIGVEEELACVEHSEVCAELLSVK